MSKNRVAVVGVSVAAALTVGMLAAPAASADAPASTAFALSATGLIKVDPTPEVDDRKGFAQDSVVEFATPNGAVQARLLNAEAGQAHAKASVADLVVDLSPVKGLNLGATKLTATAIESVCHEGKGSSSLAQAKLGDQVLDVSVPANTEIEVPGVASVVLNKQTTNDDGSLTVTAISISVTGVQTLDIASATCAPGSEEETETPAPTTPSQPGNGDDDEESDSGLAPQPTPVPAHLDVTG